VLVFVIIASGFIAGWSSWLARARRVPRWTRWVGPAVLCSTAIATALFVWVFVRWRFADAHGPDARTAMSEDISLVMNVVGTSGLIALIAIAVLGYLTLRARRRE
jgi:hypothetical protein